MIKINPGMKDIFGSEISLWEKVEETARTHFAVFNYQEIRTPLLEATELFVRGIGTETGVVKKEMYTFDDKGGDSVTLRPEGTASVVRAYIEHNLERVDPVIKLYYMGPMFRYERPQKGRLRQFHQIGCELFGAKSPASDVEMIHLADSLVRKLGITSFELQINSLGCQEKSDVCRPAFQVELKKYFTAKASDYCEDCQRRIQTNPMRVFDCKVEKCQQLSKSAPDIFPFLCGNCGPHFKAVQDGLQKLKVPFVVNSRIARGLDYYDQTAFELISHDLGSQNAFGGGGRYNGLVKSLGGPDIPAVGFALGMERLILLLGDTKISTNAPQIYLACMGEAARSEGTVLAQRLRNQGFICEIDFEDKSLKAQLRRADKLGFTHAVILGDNEIKSGKVQLKDLKKQEQKEVKLEDLALSFPA